MALMENQFSPSAPQGADDARAITAEAAQKMSAAELDALIADLRSRQRYEPPALKWLKKRKNGEGGMFPLSGDYSESGDSYRDLLPKAGDNPFARDMANLRGDMERVGRDMWIAYLLHLRSLIK